MENDISLETEELKIEVSNSSGHILPLRNGYSSEMVGVGLFSGWNTRRFQNFHKVAILKNLPQPLFYWTTFLKSMLVLFYRKKY